MIPLFLSLLPAAHLGFTIRLRQVALFAGVLLCAQAPVGLTDPVLDKAEGFLKAGRVDAASAIYQEYLKTRPNALVARQALAEIALRRFEYAQARMILEATLARHPESAETAAMLGRLFQLWGHSPTGLVSDNTRDYQALAQEHFRQASQLGPDSPLVLTYTAEWALQQNDLITAERNLQRAVQINPTYVPAFQGFTRFYIRTRDLQRAKDAALHAIELDPMNQMSYFLTAQLLALANRPAEAVKYALKSEQLDYGRLPERDYFLASQLERLGDLPQAVQYYENLSVYTPREAGVWLKLGELYERLNRPGDSLSAYQKAIALQPDLLVRMLAEAREQTLAEKIDPALSRWRRLLVMRADDAALVDEAAGATASLHMLRHFYQPDQPSAGIQADYQKLSAMSGSPTPRRQLDLIKLRMVMQRDLTPELRTALEPLTLSGDPATAGEAYFLLGRYVEANAAFEMVDGKTAEEYAALADRLLAMQELVFSRVFYERAYSETRDPRLETAMKRIQAKQALATQRVDEGNILFNAKNYAGAIEKYTEASRIYRQWENVYLRLGDTHERLKQWREAKQAYDTAVALSPSLMDSQGFAKNYNRLKKRVSQ